MSWVRVFGIKPSGARVCFHMFFYKKLDILFEIWSTKNHKHWRIQRPVAWDVIWLRSSFDNVIPSDLVFLDTVGIRFDRAANNENPTKIFIYLKPWETAAYKRKLHVCCCKPWKGFARFPFSIISAQQKLFVSHENGWKKEQWTTHLSRGTLK